MELTNTFDVPVPPAQAFDVLRDIQRIGPCMPGATIDEVDGDHFTGRVKVKIGPIQVTYRGEADYESVDTEKLSATINARGRESRGSGTANATVTASVTDGPDGGSTVHVVTDLAITGKPAQFGRGVMVDVGEKLIGQFADCLAGELARTITAADEDVTPAMGTPVQSAAATAQAGVVERDTSLPPERPAARAASAAATAREPEAIDLLDVAGASVAKRVGPVVVGALVVLLVLRWIGRKRR